jgi:hypothetical protein
MHILCLVTAILMAKLAVSVLPPVVAVIFKWIIIGRYRTGTYKMYVYFVIRASNICIEYGVGGLHTIYDGGWSIKS